MSKNNLIRGIMQILTANVINMFFSICTNFILPKFLPTESYAQIKSYQLYIAYIGILHFGYCDGIYLKYGGKSADEIDKNELVTNLSTLRLFQLVVTAMTVGISFLFRDWALLLAAFSIFPQNMIAYFKNMYQAVGEFKKYSRIMNLTTGFIFLINIVLLSIIKTYNYIYYLAGYLGLYVLLWLMLERSLNKRTKIKSLSVKFSWYEFRVNVSSGILLLLGNFSSLLLTGMDRFFVKILLSHFAFAQYAFAVSMENFLNIAITPVSITMYNYFCKHDSKEDILNIRELIIEFAALIVISAFPVKFLVEIFLPNYMDSLFVIFLLFAAQMFYVIIKCIYVNLYKARKMQKKYFSKLVIIVIIAFVFNVVCFFIYRHMASFAVGTLLSAITWFFLSQLDFKELKYKPRHYIFIFSELTVFISCGKLFNSILGFAIYTAFTTTMLYICMPYSYKQSISILENILGKLSHKH